LKLLFDANLSPKLVGRLGDLFPGSAHVFDTGLARSTPDEQIWSYAAAEGYTIVTADSDFLELAESRGMPPTVVYLENCDYRTSQVESVLRRHAVRIAALEQSSRTVLTIRKAS
jgi:predicted nuclease of predicted toxin-antitoxin system